MRLCWILPTCPIVACARWPRAIISAKEPFLGGFCGVEALAVAALAEGEGFAGPEEALGPVAPLYREAGPGFTGVRGAGRSEEEGRGTGRLGRAEDDIAFSPDLTVFAGSLRN